MVASTRPWRKGASHQKVQQLKHQSYIVAGVDPIHDHEGYLLRPTPTSSALLPFGCLHVGLRSPRWLFSTHQMSAGGRLNLPPRLLQLFPVAEMRVYSCRKSASRVGSIAHTYLSSSSMGSPTTTPHHDQGAAQLCRFIFISLAAPCLPLTIQSFANSPLRLPISPWLRPWSLSTPYRVPCCYRHAFAALEDVAVLLSLRYQSVARSSLWRSPPPIFPFIHPH